MDLWTKKSIAGYHLYCQICTLWRNDKVENGLEKFDSFVQADVLLTVRGNPVAIPRLRLETLDWQEHTKNSFCCSKLVNTCT
jgi:hypothetical protein